MLALHSGEQPSVLRGAFGQKRIQELVLGLVVGMQQPEDLAEVIAETPSPKGVPVDHRSDLARGVPEGAFEGVVQSDHVAGVCQYWAVNRHRIPPLAGLRTSHQRTKAGEGRQRDRSPGDEVGTEGIEPSLWAF